MIILIFLVLGLLVGSFLNVLVYRLHSAEEIFLDRSKCPHCENKIRWYDNIPIFSFVLLKARCRDCKEKISWQYPLVEVLSGVVSAVIGYQFFVSSNLDSWVTSGLYLWIAFSLIAIFVYDWLYMEIPSGVLWTAAFFAAGLNLWLARSDAGNLGALAVFSFFFFLVVVSKEKWMGMGDAYLVILLGLFLGWPKIILAVFLAFAAGALYGIVLLAAKKKNLKSAVPFAPFLVVGTFIALWFYAPIVDWYLGLFWR